jgi:hypothetical protein
MTRLRTLFDHATVGKALWPLLLALVAASAGAMAYVVAPQSIDARAGEIVAKCADAEYRPTCYEEEIPKVMDQGVSMEDAFEITRLVQRTDPSFVYCHVLGHKLSAKETAKDPAKWKDVAARSPIGLCSYGGIHGAFQERFRSEWLTPENYGDFVAEVKDVCEERDGWRPTGVERGSCVHALGHLTMFVANGSVKESLSLCRQVLTGERQKDSLPLCYDGVFMQVFQPLEPEDFALVDSFRPKTESEAKRFCAEYRGAELSSCTSERWPYSRDEIEKDASALSSYCADAGDSEAVSFCYLKMVNLMTARKQFSPQAMQEYCALARTGEEKKSCIVNATSRMLENDLAHAEDAFLMCEGTGDPEIAHACYKHLSVMVPYSIPNESEQFRRMCLRMPEPYDGYCFAGAYRR